jgi:hypothetical protein
MLLWTYIFGGQGFENLTDLVNEKIKLQHKSNNDNSVLLAHLYTLRFFYTGHFAGACFFY